MEILYTDIYSVGALFATVAFSFLSFLFLSLTVYSICCKEYEGAWCLVLVLVFALVALAAFHDYTTPKYEAIITDMSEFDTSKYEIVEQRGKIFVIHEVNQ